ncbi:hypothetical protein [Microcella humidisoli]|uniref:Uncharacterized protein n=1 Tax=Microcella humidisoli TaxID=2963406 RepID=A0ABY5FWT0_9MICO|nr:hypothetical protein [Microcella humidisoli]UTT62523.1 hypothetical protein NNL39_12870 [Microcella humidisoli]
MVAREPHRLLSAVLSVRNGRLTELDCVSQGRLAFFPPGLAEISGWVMTAEPVASTREP